MKKYCTGARLKPNRADFINPVALCLMSKDLDGSAPQALGWFCSLCAAVSGRHPVSLEPLASWGLGCNPDYTFTASWDGLQALHADFPATPWASLPFEKGRCHNSFTPASFMTLNREQHGQYCHVWLPAWNGAWAPS